ncbi:iron-containing alcohol dehydrogenase [Scatolibacter rhodanostii]|uniref:iron-containing alcohol dehydrogenase n=1 Tax=Scatolibacter rhodanostii TaxID=2014781 RepID=UPI000C076682|nr:iron-containing alcohol dehydrogenase [Scatolibacter rhodanostii]
MTYSFTMPVRTLVGEGAIFSAKDSIEEMGKKAFIVTGKHVGASGAVSQLKEALSNWGIESCVFDEITGEPTNVMIEEGVSAYRQSASDFIIGIGGGSPLDSAKAIAAMSVLPGAIADYVGKEIQGDFPPMVLIPTTAGTGSESTKFSVITDLKTQVKMLLRGDDMLPKLAIIDPLYALTAPKSVIAATGMDALTHAVEAYTSKKASTLTDLWALDAIKRIFTFLPISYKQTEDKTAREEMAVAAYEAGICINNSSVTLVHGMSRPIGALFHVPHGISNAMLIKECLSYAVDGCPERFATMAKTIGVAKESDSTETAINAFFTALGELMKLLEIPTLAEYGIDEGEFMQAAEKMAQDAVKSGSPGNTRKEIQVEDILIIYKKLWQ